MKTLNWLGNSKKCLSAFPKAVIQELGYALYLAQKGDSYAKAKLFKGHGSGVYEIATEYDKKAYRAVYTQAPSICSFWRRYFTELSRSLLRRIP